jgi:hypothetical protein
MSNLPRRFITFFRLPWRTRFLLIYSFIWLGIARFVVLTLPFRWIAHHFGTHQLEGASNETPEILAKAKRVAWAVRLMSRYTPWNSNCLAQAIAAKRLLRRQQVPTTLYLGVARKKEDDGLEAHAWLRCGDFFVTGGRGHLHFTVVSYFTEEKI